MVEKGRAQIGGRLETDLKTPEKPQTSEQLHNAQTELQEQGIRTLTDYNALLDSPEGGKYAVFIGAIKMILDLITTHVPKDEKDKNKKEESSSTGSSVSKKSEKIKEKDNKINEIEKKLEDKKRKLKKTREVSSVPKKSKEKFQPSNIFYVGDSYMRGITSGRVDMNRHAQGSRPFVAYGKAANKIWGGNDVETVANKALDNPNCKLLVLTGGLNDFFSYGNPGKTYERVRVAYQRIINRAKEKGVKLVIYKVPKIKKIPIDRKTGKKRYEKKDKINMYTDMLNDWLDQEWLLTKNSNIDLVDTNGAIGDNWGDSIHPDKKGYANLYMEVQDYIA